MVSFPFMKVMYSPFAAANPALRAEEKPPCFLCMTLTAFLTFFAKNAVNIHYVYYFIIQQQKTYFNTFMP